MKSIATWIKQQWIMVINNPLFAIGLGVLFSIIPLTDWLSQVIVDLVTLRRGPQQGLRILLPISVLTFAYTCLSTVVSVALLNVSLAFLPGYFAAILLRRISHWQAPAYGFIIATLLIASLVHAFCPEFIITQYTYLKNLINSLPHNHWFDLRNIDSKLMANYIFGFQIMGIILSTLFSLIIARSIQSDLFYPQGFRQEMLYFRAEKWLLYVYAVILIGATQKNALAINLVPVLGLYFLLGGLSLGFYIVALKYSPEQKWTSIILIVSLLLVPWFFGPLYAALGMLDSIFNFRSYLSVSSGKTT